MIQNYQIQFKPVDWAVISRTALINILASSVELLQNPTQELANVVMHSVLLMRQSHCQTHLTDQSGLLIGAAVPHIIFMWWSHKFHHHLIVQI